MRVKVAMWAAAVTVLAVLTVAPTGHSHRPAPIPTQAPAAVNAVAPYSATTAAPPMPHHVMPKGIRVQEAAVRVIASVSWPPSTTTTAAPTTTNRPTTTTAAANNPATTGMGAPGSFQACVAWRESTDGQGSSDIYGILPYIWTDVIGFPGSPYDASLATQDAAFWKLYDMDGPNPWRPYDGC